MQTEIPGPYGSFLRLVNSNIFYLRLFLSRKQVSPRRDKRDQTRSPDSR
ncbi:hypothetical protein Cabys_2162 [Caldithrix abyssi DSM 13497]|uniref:Uncharacterized protein n=1 Tax=Caldithrix abyssi DSM 13497 TaxID=880073 RepID=A0A1J1C8D6_CALAY|nr:hypothetical protein Cabys_2162 [Caldithrix abyssi DSM 13497]